MPEQEINKQPEEFKGSKEYNKDPKEEVFAKEYVSTNEVDSVNKEYATSKKVERIKKDAQAGGKLATGAAVVGVASLIVIGTSGLVNINMDGKIESLTFQDNKIVYEVNVEDVEKGNTMYFEIYEGKSSKVSLTKEILTDVKEPLTGKISGAFEVDELKIGDKLKTEESLSYTFHLCGNTGLVNRTYHSFVLEINSFESIFRSVSYRSDYANSGTFKFLMDFSDDYGIFTDFEASLKDSDGKIKKCLFTDNLHDEQSISILDMAGGDAYFELSFNSNGTKETYGYEVLI